MEPGLVTGAYHDVRFTPDVRRDALWETLWQAYFRRHIRPDFTVLDLGCGYGSFINSVRCTRRIALDVWPDFAKHLAPDVEAVVSTVTDLSRLADESIDFAMASNIFEHITRDELATVLAALRLKLRTGGTLTILQPNYRYASAEYFDDYTHVTVWSHVSLPDFLRANGFEVLEVQPRFLPLTIKSRLPMWPVLVKLYLASPFHPMGKQMLIRARVA
jgi:SAM-dependent methyltransferase